MNVLKAVSLWTLVTITPSVQSQLRCQASDISFQLLSGYVYTNTNDIIKTVVSRTKDQQSKSSQPSLFIFECFLSLNRCELDVLIYSTIMSLLVYELKNSFNICISYTYEN